MQDKENKYIGTLKTFTDSWIENISKSYPEIKNMDKKTIKNKQNELLQHAKIDVVFEIPVKMKIDEKMIEVIKSFLTYRNINSFAFFVYYKEQESLLQEFFPDSTFHTPNWKTYGITAIYQFIRDITNQNKFTTYVYVGKKNNDKFWQSRFSTIFKENLEILKLVIE